ncbi:MAG: AbrB/MazE/SpoVT family DNA-binding domain-containing protein [Gammaproteobacteria bacterium]
MAEAILDIKHWGNSLGVRLPAPVARAAGLHADERVRLTVVDGSVIITPVREGFASLEDRLASFDPVRHGGESMPTDERLGAERW